jgi:phosphatidylinositol 3,5-bisphosphate 5-phosphatase
MTRYIDQCEELLDAPEWRGERKDWEMYYGAVRIAAGFITEAAEVSVPKEYVAYVDHSKQYLDPSRSRESMTVAYNYERWLTGVYA